MNQSKIAVRYAKALFLSAKESEKVSKVGDDIRRISDLYARSPEFADFLRNMAMKKSRKKELITLILEPYIDALTLRFILLVTENRREEFLYDICRDYVQIMQENLGILPVMVTTASSMTPATRENIKRHLEAETGKTIELKDRVNPEIIGGLILRIGDFQYNGSVIHHLNKVREELLGKEFV